jgi:hypothetical protein
MALELAEDGRGGVARELRAPAWLEPVDRLDQAQACDLQQVVERLVGVRVAKRKIAGQRQEPLDQLLTRNEIALVVIAHKQLPLGFARLGAVAILASRDAGNARRRERNSTHLSRPPSGLFT